MAYLIGVSNEKGGVAKTTTTISLGAVLADLNHRVLVVDLDPQANLSLAFGFEPSTVRLSMANLLLEKVLLGKIIQPTTIPGLDLAPSSYTIAAAEKDLPSRQGYESILKNSLAGQVSVYDYVLFDCPAFLGAITMNVFSAVDLLLIPTQAEFFSIYALRNLMALVRRVRTQTNSALKYRLLLTMVDRRNKTHRLMTDQLRSAFASGVMQTVIEIDTKLRESPIAGEPIIQHSPKSRGAQQYRALAEEIIAFTQLDTSAN